MSIYDQKQVEQLRKRYPKGTRLCLDFMDEPGMPPGLQGTVAYIDDAGQIHMHWEWAKPCPDPRRGFFS